MPVFPCAGSSRHWTHRSDSPHCELAYAVHFVLSILVTAVSTASLGMESTHRHGLGRAVLIAPVEWRTDVARPLRAHGIAAEIEAVAWAVESGHLEADAAEAERSAASGILESAYPAFQECR